MAWQQIHHATIYYNLEQSINKKAEKIIRWKEFLLNKFHGQLFLVVGFLVSIILWLALCFFLNFSLLLLSYKRCLLLFSFNNLELCKNPARQFKNPKKYQAMKKKRRTNLNVYMFFCFASLILSFFISFVIRCLCASAHFIFISIDNT